MAQGRKKRWCMVLAAVSAAVTVMLWQPVVSGGDRAEKVRVVRVETGRVAQVLAVTGRVGYEEEYGVLMPQSGVVEQVCVSAGDRVAKGQLLLRMDGTKQESGLSKLLKSGGEDASVLASEMELLMDTLSVRAPGDGVVQRVEVTRHAGALAGTPVMIISGGRQEIRCPVAMADVSGLAVGMAATVFRAGEEICRAQVVSIGPAVIQETTGQTVSEVTLVPDRELSLPMGAAVDAEIALALAENVPVLPVEAITEKDTVWWVSEGRAYETPTEVLLADELLAWVDLPEGITVAVGNGDLHDGCRIREVD